MKHRKQHIFQLTLINDHLSFTENKCDTIADILEDIFIHDVPLREIDCSIRCWIAEWKKLDVRDEELRKKIQNFIEWLYELLYLSRDAVIKDLQQQLNEVDGEFNP